jgi:hypothetical protein
LPKKHAFSHTELVEVSHNTPINKHNETFRQAQGDKCVSPITKEDFKQMLRYLKTGKFRLGLIVNFRGNKAVIKRIVNSDLKEN